MYVVLLEGYTYTDNGDSLNGVFKAGGRFLAYSGIFALLEFDIELMINVY